MNVKDIEKIVINDEKAEKQKTEKSLKKVLQDECKIEKIIDQTMKLAKKEGIEVYRCELESLTTDMWENVKEDFEYIPGYIEEYVDALKGQFYNNGKVSIPKIAQYLLNKYIDG